MYPHFCLMGCDSLLVEFHNKMEPRRFGSIWPHGHFPYSHFPGGPAVKNPPANAGDTGPIPGLVGKIPRALRQLGLYTTTTEPMHSTREATTTRSPCTATKTKRSQKLKKETINLIKGL